MLSRPHFACQHAHHEEGKLRGCLREDVGRMRERDFVLIGVRTIDVVEPHGNLRHHLQRVLARLENFSVNLIAQGCDQSIDSGFDFLNNQTLRRSFRLGINFNLIAALPQLVQGIANVAGSEDTEFLAHESLAQKIPRVVFSINFFSHNPKTTRGRTANTGSFIERMSFSIDAISQSYLPEYFASNRRRVGTSATRAVPSTITASCACSVETTQLGFFARFRALRDLRPVLNKNWPSIHKPQTTMVCGEPSGLTVVIQ